ncbi:hypothetical protein SAG0088_06980 [Streptococcus agalactiae LMG 15092]|nr:hypothetical protein SAG0088_06980 [Streptococcus agalactiae LMG 15092]
MNNEKLEQIEQLLQTLIKLIQIKEQNIPLKIIQQRELLKQLNISPNTLKTWEQKGLKRLEPPIEGTRTVFYLLDDIIKPVVLVNLKNTIKSLKGLYCECLNKQEVSPNEPLTVYS